METVILQELKPYSFIELQKKFKVNEETLKKILKSLSLLNIVKRLPKDISKIELDEFLNVDNIEEINNQIEGNMYVFKYVGIITVGIICLIIYPKYITNYLSDKENNYKILKQLIAVIRKYQSKKQNLGINEQQDLQNFNLLSIVLELIFNYHEHGFYNNDKQIIEQNGNGEIIWEKTINENTVYFSNNLPLYLDTFTINQKSNEQDYFRRLHACILSEACKKVKNILNILDIENINVGTDDLNNFGNNEYIIYRINQEISTQFVTYKQNILNLIKRYINEDKSKDVWDNISFVGTNSFNLVWEDVCSVVMNNCINKSIKELGLKYLDNKQSMLLSDIIPKPKWKHFESQKIHISSKTLEPDIITINENKFSIYDAKYYKIKLNDMKVENQPGVGDVTKQYLYELSYKKFVKDNNLLIDKNAFLMPTDGKQEKEIGIVSMDIFKALGETKFCDIYIILKPCEEMYKKYLDK